MCRKVLWHSVSAMAEVVASTVEAEVGAEAALFLMVADVHSMVVAGI